MLARHTVDVERLEGSRGEYGEAESTATHKLTRQADVRPASARERFEASQTQAEITHVIKLRYDALLADVLTHNARLILDGSRTLEIVSVMNVDERNREFEVRALEKAAG